MSIMATKPSIPKRPVGRPRKPVDESKPKRGRGRPRLPEEVKAERRKGKLSKSDPLFFAKLGRRGGNNTRKNQDADYFRRIAVLSHQVRREKKAETERQQKAQRGGR